MSHRFIFLRRIIDLVLMNVFFIDKNRFKFVNNIKKQEKNSHVLIELNLHNIISATIHVLLSLVLSKRFKIIFFYYSKYDHAFKNKLFYFLSFNYFNFLKKNCNSEIINLFTKPSEVENVEAEKVFMNLKNLNSLIKLRYRGFEVGKYIYQSYSRELLKEQVNIKDQRLKKFIIEAFTYINNLNILFKNIKCKKLFITHSIFIRYGILCNFLSKSHKPEIYIFQPGDRRGNFLKNIDFIKINLKHLVQMESYWNYKSEFKKLKNKKKLLNISKKELNQRIYGSKINKHIMIGEINPYTKKEIINFKNTKKEKVIILASNFFDSAFFYRNSLYAESYTYTKKLLNIAKNTNFEWYIKPHPDGQPENDILIKKLQENYPFLKILPKSISNISFKNNNFKSMFSFEGTAIHEFVFMNIPSYCVGDNKQSAYKFGTPSKNYSSFKSTVLNANKEKKFNLKDVYEFNYMYTFQKSKDFISCDFLSKKDREFLKKNYEGNFFERHSSLLYLLKFLENKKNELIKNISSL